jgi:hypothetical protein
VKALHGNHPRRDHRHVRVGRERAEGRDHLGEVASKQRLPAEELELLHPREHRRVQAREEVWGREFGGGSGAWGSPSMWQ